MANLKPTTVRGSFSATRLIGNADTATAFLDESLGTEISLQSLSEGMYSFDPTTAGDISFTDLNEDLKNKPFFLNIFKVSATVVRQRLYIDNTITTLDGDLSLPLIYERNVEIDQTNGGAFKLMGYGKLSINAITNGHYLINDQEFTEAKEWYAILGDTVTIQAVPDEFYKITQFDVDGIPEGNPYELRVTGNHSVVAAIAEDQCNVTITQPTGATIKVTYEGEVHTESFVALRGKELKIDVELNEAYNLTSLMFNDESISSGVTRVVEDDTVAIYATTAIKRYNVVINQPASGGVITAVLTDGTQYTNTFTVDHGTEVTFKVAVSEGYTLDALNYGSEVIQNNSSQTILANVTVSATISLNIYHVTITQPANGLVTVNAGGTNYTSDFDIAHGTTLIVTATANNGYSIESLTVNNSETPSGSSFVIVEDTTIVATTDANDCTITIPEVEGATITVVWNEQEYTEPFVGKYGTNVTINVVPDAGYQIDSILWNDTPITSGVTELITGNAEIVVEASKIPIGVNITQPAGATITATVGEEVYNESFTTYYGDTVKFDIVSNEGYTAKQFTITYSDGTTQPVTVTLENGTGSYEAVFTQNIDVAVVAYRNSYTITASSGQGYTINHSTVNVPTEDIDPDGSLAYNAYWYGTTFKVTANALTGYEITKVLCNDEEIANGSTQTLTQNTILSAEAQLKTYTVTIIQPEHGTISVGSHNETFVANHGDTFTITATPDTSYKFDTLTWNGEVIESGASKSVTSAVTVTGTTSLAEVTLTVTKSDGCTLKINDETVTSGNKVYMAGDTLTIEVSPLDGYKIDSVKFNGGELTVSEEIPYCDVTIVQPENGRIEFTCDELGISKDVGTSYRLLKGMKYKVELIADEGYVEGDMDVSDTVPAPEEEIGAYVYSAVINSNSTLEVVASLKTATLTVTKEYDDTVFEVSVNGQKITDSNKVQTLPLGSVVNLTVKSNSDADIAGVRVNGELLGGGQEIRMRTLTVNQPENGKIEVTCPDYNLDKDVGTSYTFLEGTKVTIELVPNEGYIVDHLDVSDTDPQPDPIIAGYEYSFILDEDSELTFDLTLQVTVNQPENGTIQLTCEEAGIIEDTTGGSYTVPYGAKVTAYCVADDGYVCDNLNIEKA